MVRLLGHYVAFSSIFLVVIETGVFLVILGLLRLYPIGSEILGPAESQAFQGFDILFALLNFAVLSSLGYYNRSAFHSRQARWRTALMSFPVAYAVLCAAVYLLESTGRPELGVYYRNFFVAIMAFSMFSASWRGSFHSALDLDIFCRFILVIGHGEQAREIQNIAARSTRSGFRILGYFPNGFEEEDYSLQPVLPGEILKTRRELARFAAENRVDEIVVAVKERRRPKGALGDGLPIWDLLECRLEGVQISYFHDFWEKETGRMNLGELHPSSLIFSDGFRNGPARDALKRIFDIFVSSILLVVFAPIMVATWCAVRITSPGPAFYVQERVGLHGTQFKLMKFRSMRQDAEKDGVPQWATSNDDRVTPVGKFIRKARLDELPQLFNVLRGEMSLVGPRPERQFFVESLSKEIPFYNERHIMRPGVTGWAQVNYPYGASVEDAKIKLSYDIYYAKNHSFFLDMVIVLQTIRVMLFAHGGR